MPKDIPSYPIWNQIYIGINEKEFGFMDNDLSYDRDLKDIKERVCDYGTVKLLKIICKKTFWLWTQGTYQAERYAFGNDTNNALDKFEYETFLTQYLLNSNQHSRIIINAIMRAQYFVIFIAMTITIIIKRDITQERELYYIIVATLLVMIIWELKSRYILICFPMMAILAQQCFDNLSVKL